MGICDCIINILYYLNMPFFSPFISTSAREGLQKTELFWSCVSICLYTNLIVCCLKKLFDVRKTPFSFSALNVAPLLGALG